MTDDPAELVWHDEMEIPAKKFVLVRRPDDQVVGDEIHQLITRVGISKIEMEENSFYSLDLGSSYANMSTSELEALWMMIGKALRYT